MWSHFQLGFHERITGFLIGGLTGTVLHVHTNFSRRNATGANRDGFETGILNEILEKQGLNSGDFRWIHKKKGRRNNKKKLPEQKKGGARLSGVGFSYNRAALFFFIPTKTALVKKLPFFGPRLHISCRALMGTLPPETSLQVAPKFPRGTSALTLLQSHLWTHERDGIWT